MNQYLRDKIYQPPKDSHKGQNGRLLVIGGSPLFHAAPFWAARVASKVVDLVHFSSPDNEANALVRQKLKEGFWQGIVIDYGEVESYIEEDEVILIGPGMTREAETSKIINDLLGRYPNKRWVVDGGALQECDPNLLNDKMIITPHQGEWARLMDKIHDSGFMIHDWNNLQERTEVIKRASERLGGVTILAKGMVDVVCRGNEVMEVSGGNAGMTKGGTGDVLAGLTAALYCKNEAFDSAVTASKTNKRAAEALAGRVGVYFNADDLVDEVPKELARMVGIEN